MCVYCFLLVIFAISHMRRYFVYDSHTVWPRPLFRLPLGECRPLTDVNTPSLPFMKTPSRGLDTAVLCFLCILLKLTNYKQMVYRNKVYRVIILHITYSNPHRSSAPGPHWGLPSPRHPGLPLHPCH